MVLIVDEDEKKYIILGDTDTLTKILVRLEPYEYLNIRYKVSSLGGPKKTEFDEEIHGKITIHKPTLQECLIDIRRQYKIKKWSTLDSETRKKIIKTAEEWCQRKSVAIDEIVEKIRLGLLD